MKDVLFWCHCFTEIGKVCKGHGRGDFLQLCLKAESKENYAVCFLRSTGEMLWSLYNHIPFIWAWLLNVYH